MSERFWVFPIDPEQGESVRQIAVSLQPGDLKKTELERLRKDLVRSLNAVIDSGFEFYYERPSENSSLKPMVQRTIRSIINTVRQAIHLVVQRVFKSMPHADLARMANYMDSMVLPPREEGRPALLAYPLGDELSQRLDELMEMIRQSDQVSDYDQALYRLFTDIVEASVRYYYREPTNMVSLNRFAKKAADVGIDTTIKGIKSILKRVVKEVKHEEVAALPDNIHFLVADRELDYKPCSPDFISEK